VGDGSPGSREAEGEGGEGFYVAQSGRCLDLLVIGGAAELERRRLNIAFPVLAGERRAATLTPVGGAPRRARVIPGYARGDPHPMLNICTVATGTGFTLEPGGFWLHLTKSG